MPESVTLPFMVLYGKVIGQLYCLAFPADRLVNSVRDLLWHSPYVTKSLPKLRVPARLCLYSSNEPAATYEIDAASGALWISAIVSIHARSGSASITSRNSSKAQSSD